MVIAMAIAAGTAARPLSKMAARTLQSSIGPTWRKATPKGSGTLPAPYTIFLYEIETSL